MSEDMLNFQGGKKSSNYGDSRYSTLHHHVNSDMLWGYAPDMETVRQQTQQNDRLRVSSWHSVGGSENSIASIKESTSNMRIASQKRANIKHKVALAVTIAGVSLSAVLIIVPLMNLLPH